MQRLSIVVRIIIYGQISNEPTKWKDAAEQSCRLVTSLSVTVYMEMVDKNVPMDVDI